MQASPTSNVGQEQQVASQQGDCSYSGGLLPLVIDLQDSSQSPGVVASTATPSTALTQAVEQPTQLIATTEACIEPVETTDQSTAAEYVVTTEVTATADCDVGAVIDLTAPEKSCEASSSSSSTHDRHTTSGGVTVTSPASSAVLSDEYRKRYEKYENLCALITLKDHELAELNNERKRLHQLLVDLQRAILARPVATAAVDADDGSSTAPASCTEPVADGDRRSDNDELEQGKVAATTTTSVAYRRRLAHRGVTSVRVMVKSTQPPTAHSNKINLSRYNSLFCNYEETTDHRRPSTEVAVANEDARTSIQATDLTAGASERNTKYGGSLEEVAQPPAQPRRALDGASLLLHTTSEKQPKDVDAVHDRRVVSEASAATHGIELVAYQQRLDDVPQTSSVSVLESYLVRDDTAAAVAARNATFSRHSGPTGVHTAPETTERAGLQVVDAARQQQFAMATTNETILSAAHSRRDVADQRPVVLSTLRPEMSLVLSSPGKHRPAGVEVDASDRSISQRRELRPPPPYPHQRPDLPHRYPAMVAPGLSPREQVVDVQSPRSQLHYSEAQPATVTYRKENSAGPRTVYVQPMRAENQTSAVVQPNTVCADREVDVIVFQQPSSDISPRGHVVSDATFLGNRLSPPAMPQRMSVRAAYDKRPAESVREPVAQTHYLHHVTPAKAQPLPRIIGTYHGNRLSSPQTSRSASDGVHQQRIQPQPPIATDVEQRHVTMTSSSARDVINRHYVDRPLDQLQHFVDGRPGQPAVDAGDPRLRHLSPLSAGLKTSGHFNNGDGRNHHGLVVGADYSQQDAAAIRQMRAAGDCVAITEADFARRGAGLSFHQAQTEHSPRFPSGAVVPPHQVLLLRDPNASQPLSLRGLPHSRAAGQVATAVDMSGAKQRRFSSLNQVPVTTYRSYTMCLKKFPPLNSL